MSKITFSGIGITSMNGSIGSRTISRNAYGPYSKTKRGPVTITPALAAWQTNFQNIHIIWELLTDAQRRAWIDAAIRTRRTQQLKATLGNTPRRRVLMGFHYFMSTNLNINLATGVGIVTPAKLVPIQVPTTFSITNGFALVMHFTNLQPNWSARIYVSAQLNAGRMSNNQSYFSLATQTAGNNLDITAVFTARFGFRISGKKIFAKVDFINRQTGQRSPSLYSSIIFP